MARYCLRTATQLRTGLLVLMIACAQAGAQGLSTPAPDGAQVYFIEPADGAVWVSSSRLNSGSVAWAWRPLE